VHRQAIEKGYTDVVVVNEDNRSPNGIVISHLPNGPTAHFRLSNVKITKDIKVRKFDSTEDIQL
jgi:ribosome production factor 1